MEERHANVVFDILGSLKHSAFVFVFAVTLCDPFVTEMKYKSNIRHFQLALHPKEIDIGDSYHTGLCDSLFIFLY